MNVISSFLLASGVLRSSQPDQEGNKLECQKILMFIYPIYNHNWRSISKGKAVPFQAWSGPKGSRKLRFPDFMTMAEDGGKVISLTHRPPLPPGNKPGTHFC
jgi:hypothetical protein